MIATGTSLPLGASYRGRHFVLTLSANSPYATARHPSGWDKSETAVVVELLKPFRPPIRPLNPIGMELPQVASQVARDMQHWSLELCCVLSSVQAVGAAALILAIGKETCH